MRSMTFGELLYQIINNDDILSRVQQGNGGVAADEPGRRRSKEWTYEALLYPKFHWQYSTRRKKVQGKSADSVQKQTI